MVVAAVGFWVAVVLVALGAGAVWWWWQLWGSG